MSSTRSINSPLSILHSSLQIPFSSKFSGPRVSLFLLYCSSSVFQFDVFFNRLFWFVTEAMMKIFPVP
ncbi:unnamed protein product [Citrullus colocynthis]|uniref:Uncharacterized protein n=1 Tax=Citrullus colocynthis TaxID=252529 RepID=A0ABP0YMC4_9ROSI